MQDFEYVLARSVEEVVSLLSNHNGHARILCGGTDLIQQLRERRRTAHLVVDIKGVPETNEISYDPETGLYLGAAISCLRICSDLQVRAAYPGLIDAISLIGGVQIQGRASVGGNLCNASPAADTIPALIVHRAICILAGPQGRRAIPVEDFCIGPGQTVLQPGEFLVALRIPPPRPGFGAHYQRFTPRNEMDIAVVGVGASVFLNDDRSRFIAARIALGAVAPVPLFAREAGDYLAGREVSTQAILEAAKLARIAARPIDDMRGTAVQRRHLVEVLTRRALEKAVERARG